MSGQTNGFIQFLPLVLIFAVMYFLLIRPQQKKAKEHQTLLQNLKKGDLVISGGGIYGRITGMDEATLTVEIADKVRIKVSRGTVSAVVTQMPKDQQAS